MKTDTLKEKLGSKTLVTATKSTREQLKFDIRAVLDKERIAYASVVVGPEDVLVLQVGDHDSAEGILGALEQAEIFEFDEDAEEDAEASVAKLRDQFETVIETRLTISRSAIKSAPEEDAEDNEGEEDENNED